MLSDCKDKTLRLEVLRSTLLTRHCELAIELLVQHGLLQGPVHSSLGHEWIAALCVSVLDHSDWIYPYYRCHAWLLARGTAAIAFLEQLRNADRNGKAMHLGDSSLRIASANAYVAQHVPIAAGRAWLQAQLESSSLVLASIGEGALASGLVLESLSIARRNRAPLLLCVEDNGVQNYAVTNREEAVTAEAISAAARIPFLHLSLSRHESTQLSSLTKFVRRIRETRIPGVVHCDTVLEHPHSFGPNHHFVSATGGRIQPDAVAGRCANALAAVLGVSESVLRDMTCDTGHEVEAAVNKVFGSAFFWQDKWFI